VVEIIVPVLVALITAGIPATIAIMRMKRKNTEEHGKSYTLLQSLDEGINRVESKVDSHLGWHKRKKDE